MGVKVNALVAAHASEPRSLMGIHHTVTLFN